jgi:hypothetical protein
MDHDFIEKNEASLRELRSCVESLKDEDFDRRLGNGWTVAEALCHLAFWDRVMLGRIERWERDGVEPAILDTRSADPINDGVHMMSGAVSGREAARMVLDSAEATDAKVASLGAETVERMAAGGFERMLLRHLHRREHLRRL